MQQIEEIHHFIVSQPLMSPFCHSSTDSRRRQANLIPSICYIEHWQWHRWNEPNAKIHRILNDVYSKRWISFRTHQHPVAQNETDFYLRSDKKTAALSQSVDDLICRCLSLAIASRDRFGEHIQWTKIQFSSCKAHLCFSFSFRT